VPSSVLPLITDKRHCPRSSRAYLEEGVQQKERGDLGRPALGVVLGSIPLLLLGRRAQSHHLGAPLSSHCGRHCCPCPWRSAGWQQET